MGKEEVRQVRRRRRRRKRRRRRRRKRRRRRRRKRRRGGGGRSVHKYTMTRMQLCCILRANAQEYSPTKTTMRAAGYLLAGDSLL